MHEQRFGMAIPWHPGVDWPEGVAAQAHRPDYYQHHLEQIPDPRSADFGAPAPILLPEPRP